MEPLCRPSLSLWLLCKFPTNLQPPGPLATPERQYGCPCRMSFTTLSLPLPPLSSTLLAACSEDTLDVGLHMGWCRVSIQQYLVQTSQNLNCSVTQQLLPGRPLCFSGFRLLYDQMCMTIPFLMCVNYYLYLSVCI